MRWTLKPLPDKEKIEKLAQDLQVDSTIANVLFQRNIETFEDAKNFFRPSLDAIHDPFLMKDMDAAVARIERAIANNENILVYSTNKKRDKGKWASWCPAEVTEKNKLWFVSAKDHNLLISENKGICMVSEGKFKMTNGKVGIVRSNTSVVDFTKKTYTTEYFWMDEKKKFKKKTKCKIIKS